MNTMMQNSGKDRITESVKVLVIANGLAQGEG